MNWLDIAKKVYDFLSKLFKKDTRKEAQDAINKAESTGDTSDINDRIFK